MKKLLIGILAFLIMATPAQADLLGVKWKVHAPFTLYVTSTIVDPNLQSALSLAAADWSISTVVDVVIANPPRRAPTVPVSDGYWSDPWSGLTSISTDHGYIIGASIRLNRSWLDARDANGKQRVICQELGHALGLDHQDSATDSCMGPYSTGVHPNALDYSDLELAYGH